jgi:hypothetical protein
MRDMNIVNQTKENPRSGFLSHLTSHFSRLTPYLFVALLAAACPPRQDLLMDAVSGFNNNLRWKRFEDAGSCMPPALRAAFVKSLAKDEDRLNITDLEVKEVLLDEDRAHAAVRVRMAWYWSDVLVEKKADLVQRWERIGRDWTLTAMEGEGPWKPGALKPAELFLKDGGTPDAGR